MSAEKIADAATVPAPVAADGDVIVLATVTSASAAIPLGNSRRLQWYRFQADGTAVYLTFGAAATVAAPVISSVSGSSRAIKIEAGTYIDLQVGRTSRGAFRHISTATTGFLRIYKAGDVR